MINIEDMPENPGVYIMKRKETVIYVGKAKNIKKRVASYFRGDHGETKTQELVKKIETIEFIITNTEIEALILENNLIKKYQPKYNILLKDEKTYPYIKITREKFAKVETVRSTKNNDKENADYYGPYPKGIYYFLKMLKKVFPVRDCDRDMEKTYQKPCLKYYMNYCMGPCKFKNCEIEYKNCVEGLKAFLEGKSAGIIKELKKQMETASGNMEFERAIALRDRVKELERIQEKQITEYNYLVNEDIVVFREIDDKLFIFGLNVRDGKMSGRVLEIIEKKYFADDLFEAVVVSFYSKYPVPKNIIFEPAYREQSHKIEEWFLNTTKKKIILHFPEIASRRKELLEMAVVNIKNEIETYEKKNNLTLSSLKELKYKLGLTNFPIRIECFDISNIQGKDAVASMSVSLMGKTTPREYRRYKITCKDTPDDFRMMEEVLTRRYSKLAVEDLPQLILIDGGKGQLGVAEEILKRVGKSMYVDIISIAKREELVYKAGEEAPFVIDKSSETLKILQRLRDEAHRFGITYHRKLRSKRVMKSKLDMVSGIGPSRKKKLLEKYGSVENIKNIAVSELSELIPQKSAEELKQLLAENKK